MFEHRTGEEEKIHLAQLDHARFEEARRLIESKGDAYHATAADKIDEALQALYNAQELSLQRLAAAFRRGDLIGMLRRQTE